MILNTVYPNIVFLVSAIKCMALQVSALPFKIALSSLVMGVFDFGIRPPLKNISMYLLSFHIL